MNRFQFKEIWSFFSAKYLFRYNGKESIIKVTRNMFNGDTEFKLKSQFFDGKLRIKDVKLSGSTYKGVFGDDLVEIKHSTTEIQVTLKGESFDFVFQKGLITGIFVNNENVGAIDQKRNTSFGLEEYHGVIDQSIPQKALIILLVFLNKAYAKEGYLFYRYKGFVWIKPRLNCNENILNLLKNSPTDS